MQQQQWRQLSYCMAQLPISERAFTRIRDNMHCYANKIYDPQTYANFVIVIQSARKSARAQGDAKVCLGFNKAFDVLHSYTGTYR
jgi:hypothetical protein